MQLLEKLKKPYPISSGKWRVVFTISIFIPLFLGLFQPFGLRSANYDHMIFIVLGYGLVTFLSLIINVVLLPSIFKSFFAEKGWTVIKQIFWFCWNVVTIGLANYFYSEVIFNTFSIHFYAILYFIFNSFIISIIPISFLTILNYNQLLKKNLIVSNEMNNRLINQETSKNEEQEIILYSENNKQKINTTSENLLFVESVGNYVSVCYLKDKTAQKTLIRNTLKNIDEQLSNNRFIIKVHRAFIVNIIHIEKINGNSQGYRLQLRNTDGEILVSRNYIQGLKSAIQLNESHP